MNNKTPTYREKGRAVFLAAIMVLSVVAMSAAFAGSAAAQQATDVSPAANTYAEGDEISGTVDVDNGASESVFVFLDENDDGFYNSSENYVEVDVDDSDGQTSYDFDGLETEGVLGTQLGAVTGSSLDAGTDATATAGVTLQNDLEIELGQNFFSTEEDATGEVTVTNNGSVAADGVDITLGFNTSGIASETVVTEDVGTISAGDSETVSITNVSDDTDIGFQADGLNATVNGTNFGETDVSKNVYVTADDNVLVGGDVSDDAVPKQKIDSRDNVEVTITIDEAPAFMSNAEGDVLVDSVLLGDDWNDLSTVNPAVDSSNYFESSEPPGSANELDEYQLRLPGFGNETGDEIRYRIEAVPVNDLSEGFGAFDGVTRPLLQGDGDTNRDIELERLVVPDELDVTQSSESAIADGEDTITFTATVSGDENDEPFEGEEVSIETVNGEGIDIDQTTATTDENGEVEFTVSSETQQTATFRIVADSADNPDDPSDPLVQERTKSFVLSGEAELQGNVYDKTTTDPIEDGSVWVAFGDDYEDDTLNVTVDLDALDAAYDNFTRDDEDVDGSTVYVRLVQNETGDLAQGEVVPQRTYDVRAADSADVPSEPVDGEVGAEEAGTATAADDYVRELQALDTNDLRQGSGFVVIDNDNDNQVTFNITRLNPENYKLDLSLTADSPATFGNEEDLRVADDRAANFTRVTKAPGAPTWDTPDSVVVGGLNNNIDARVSNNITAPSDSIQLDGVVAQDVGVNQNMTLAATQQLAEASNAAPGIPGANFVDSPGFINSYGEDTEGTNEFGQYTLNRLPSNFQDGLQYVAIASAPGFDTDFQDVYETEDGELIFNQTQGSNDFQLQPIPVTPDEVNITNLGIHPPVEETGGAPDFDEVELFDNMTDEFSQTIPRDGSVDILLVETRGEGQLTNATADLDIPDDTNADNDLRNSTAEILTDEDGNAFVFGGDVVDEESGDLGSIHTGDAEEIPVVGELDEGEAVVLVENDESDTTLERLDDNDNSAELEPPTNQTGIFAQLTEDETATDFTRKSFPGVIVFEAGSVSGKISNDDELLPNTFIWTSEFETENGNTEFEINPNFTASPIDSFDEIADDPATANDQVSNLVFDILVIDASGSSDTVVEETQATGEELKSFDLADAFGSVSEASVSEFNLLRSQSEHTNGDYSMDQVPATEDGIDYRRLTAYQYGTADSGNGSTAEPVRPGFTVEGNVVIVGAEPIATGSADRTVDSAELASGESTQVTLNVDLDTAGDVFIQETFDPAFGDVEIVDADGADFANVNEENNEIVASWGDVESATLVYEVNVSGDASAGDSYTLTSGAESDFDAGSDVIDVVESSPLDKYTNDDGVIDTEGLQLAIDDWRTGVIDTDLLQEAIDAWRTGEVVTESPV